MLNSFLLAEDLNSRFHDNEVRIGNERVPKAYSGVITFNQLCNSQGAVESPYAITRDYECPAPYLIGRYISYQNVHTGAEYMNIDKIVPTVVYE